MKWLKFAVLTWLGYLPVFLTVRYLIGEFRFWPTGLLLALAAQWCAYWYGEAAEATK